MAGFSYRVLYIWVCNDDAVEYVGVDDGFIFYNIYRSAASL